MALQSDNQPQIVALESWAGVNQSSSRPVINDQECWWLENLFPIAEGHLRSAWGPSEPIYTAPDGVTILRIFFANIDGVNPLGFMFLSDGTVDQVNLLDQSVVSLGQIWEPIAPHYWADLKLWAPNQFGNVAGQNGGLLIGSPQGLYAWDGATVSAPGDTPPLWLTNGATTDANGDPLVMPVGLPGIYALEIYKDRLWVMGQTVISFSAGSNGADFSSASGGGTFGYHGDQLTVSRTDMLAAGGFLYLFNDSSTDVINTDVTTTTSSTTSGTAASVGSVTSVSTTFTLANNDPQIGQRFFRPVGVWENVFTLYNGSGIYLMSGQVVNWASQKITNLLQTIDPSAFEGTQCPAHIFGKKWLLYNAMLTDIWGIKRPLLLCWSGPGEGKWVIASQKVNLTHIASYEQNSCITPYGTDGTSLYRLFAQPDPHLQKRLTTKLYSGPGHPVVIRSWKRVYLEWMDKYLGPEGVFFTGTVSTHGGGLPNGVEEISFSLDPSGYDITPAPIAGQGINAGIDLISYSPDFTVARLMMTFDDRTLFGA